MKQDIFKEVPMKTKSILILAVLLITTLLQAQPANIIEVNGEKVYPAVNGHINYNHYSSDIQEYNNRLRNYYIEVVGKDDPQQIYRSPVNILLPDSLATNLFPFKKGFTVALVDSTNFYYFDIKDFHTKTSIEGSNKPRVLFTTHDSLDFYSKKLFLLTKDRENLNSLEFSSPRTVIDPIIRQNIYEKLALFFSNNREILKWQMIRMPLIPDTLDYVEFEAAVIDNFDLEVYPIDTGGYNIKGISSTDQYRHFFAFVSEDYQTISYKKNTKLYHSFKLNRQYYFFCHYSLPGTGGNIYYIYKLEDNELIPVFEDSSYSM